MSWDRHRAARLTSEERRRVENPADALARFGVSNGMTVVDVGAGVGFYAHEAARLVAPDGVVYAVDESEELLEDLAAHAPADARPLIEPIRASVPPMPRFGRPADFVLLANILHELDENRRGALLADVRDALGDAGAVGIVEWKKEETPHGPPLGERLGRDDVASLLAAAGFRLDEEFPVGPWRAGYLARKSG